MNLLVVGGGGREHALCWALARSATVFCAPGNPGTAALGTNLPVKAGDLDGIADAVVRHHIDLTVVGPEAPLAAGLADRLAETGHPVFGPTKAAAQLEASKAFSKEVMRAAGVPTAGWETFTEQTAALDYVGRHPEPLVVKASGLAAGKGAIVCETRKQAAASVREMFGGRFGEAGKTVVIEEFLQGEELSVIALTDGQQTMLLPASQDHKRLEEGDQGPNTGGMGAYTPVSIASVPLLQRIDAEVIHPVLRYLASSGAPYSGTIYAGIMLTDTGLPKVLEFNCRFGDPEAQVVLPVAPADLGEHIWSIAAGEEWHPPERPIGADGTAVTTVLASPGYPASPTTGADISLPELLPDDTILFHAGTTRDDAGRLRTSGGRVLCATGLGPDVATAASRSRELAARVNFAGKVYRKDIAWREVARAGAT